MDSRFLTDNRHLEDSNRFSQLDPDLGLLKSQPYLYHFPLINQFPLKQPGVYFLQGSHGVGKTMLLKQWMEKLLSEKISPNDISFFSSHFIKDHHELYSALKNQLTPSQNFHYIIIDNILSIPHWEKTFSALAEENKLTQSIVMLSDENATNKINVKKTFSLLPLSFRETILLKKLNVEEKNSLYNAFDHYLNHGGYLKAINEVEMHGTLLKTTLKNYFDHINQQFIHYGKQERFFREILTSIIKNYNRPITWNSLAHELTIDHPKTIGDYFDLLASLGIIFIQHALLEKSLKPAPKKARKIIFRDPFLYHAAKTWIGKEYPEQPLAEACAASEYSRYYPTYYIKDEGEVAIAYIDKKQFWPIEISWSHQLRAKNIKQILKYPNARILTKTDHSGIIEHIRTEPLPLALWQLEG